MSPALSCAIGHRPLAARSAGSPMASGDSAADFARLARVHRAGLAGGDGQSGRASPRRRAGSGRADLSRGALPFAAQYRCPAVAGHAGPADRQNATGDQFVASGTGRRRSVARDPNLSGGQPARRRQVGRSAGGLRRGAAAGCPNRPRSAWDWQRLWSGFTAPTKPAAIWKKRFDWSPISPKPIWPWPASWPTTASTPRLWRPAIERWRPILDMRGAHARRGELLARSAKRKRRPRRLDAALAIQPEQVDWLRFLAELLKSRLAFTKPSRFTARRLKSSRATRSVSTTWGWFWRTKAAWTKP